MTSIVNQAMNRELIAPKTEPTIIILLNVHKIKLSSKFVSLYTLINVTLRAYQSSFFVQWMVVNVEIRNWPKYKKINIFGGVKP